MRLSAAEWPRADACGSVAAFVTPLRYTGNRLDVSGRDDSFVVTTAGESRRRILPER